MASKGDILFAEDDPVLREIYRKKFTIAGYDVRTAVNGAETIAAIEEKAPDALVLDINMPEVNGFEVLKKYPKPNRKFPIVLLTNLADDHTREEGERLGGDGFFIKSQMTIKTLIEMVEKLLR
ncbi:MAG: response regulator [Candidatus Peribacteraceae bacterium]|nr:response regulator [Candidatus Peribacteraceae bacterium]